MLIAQFNQRAGRQPPAGSTGSTPTSPAATSRIYMAIYIGLILFFTFFYVSITFNPTEVADNMKKYGGFIPGIRAGRPTAEYLTTSSPGSRFPGALPRAHLAHPAHRARPVDANQNFPFGGTSILIIVGVGLETVKQIEAQLQQRHYEGFLR
jgi:preprotein translocase subunit SecY